MSILAGAKLKNPNLGYATDFISQLKPLLYDINKNIKIISNAGGINPESCRSILLHEAKKIGLNINIGVVYGDNLMSDLEKLKNMNFKEIDTGEKFP